MQMTPHPKGKEKSLFEPLLKASPGKATVLVSIRQRLTALIDYLYTAFCATTDEAFIRSEVNGRRSRRIVLFAFFVADAIGATLWAIWCQKVQGQDQSEIQACKSIGMNRYVLLALGVPAEGAMLFMAGRNPWSFWSDAWLIPVWLVRIPLDVLLWHAPAQTVVGDALWFSVMAVMCRVHSLALWILVLSQIASLLLVLQLQGVQDFDYVRYGIYSVLMLTIMAGAYFLDEQSRLQSFGHLMSLQDENASLADAMLRWKVIPERSSLSEMESDAADDQEAQKARSSILKKHRKESSPSLFAAAAEFLLPPLRLPNAMAEDASSLPIAGGRAPIRQESDQSWNQSCFQSPGSSASPSYSAGSAAAPRMPSAPPQNLVRPPIWTRTGQRVRFDLPQPAGRGLVQTQQPQAGTGGEHRPIDLFDVME
eukprot:TRINITY_DN9801_c0_g3_i1.p1 TRINITY_DN9801_c0_g3~~TRINITY_DN9801_c0_g3_i1.p1  ORF type:complete len:424 (+),score=78.94 TRINITY_DN9801_c0_g3_i1:118-1389(+)